MERQAVRQRLEARVRGLADVMIYYIQMADVLDVDLDKIIQDKMERNARKYPVGLSRTTGGKRERSGR